MEKAGTMVIVFGYYSIGFSLFLGIVRSAKTKQFCVMFVKRTMMSMMRKMKAALTPALSVFAKRSRRLFVGKWMQVFVRLGNLDNLFLKTKPWNIMTRLKE